MTRSVNYDIVASGYDQRDDGGYLSGVTEALQTLARRVVARRLLDLGCGTGLSLQNVGDKVEPRPSSYGLDLSAGMLAQARRRDPAYHLVQASAPKPSFASASFDLVFCAHAFHHFPYKWQVVQAAFRLLRPGGAFAIVNFDPHEHHSSELPIYEYFEGAYETDLKRFPALAEQEAMLKQAGFQKIRSPIVQEIKSELSGETILDNYHLRKTASSQLILLSEEAYQAGLQAIRNKIAEAKIKGATIIFRTRLKNRMCHGFKP